MVKKTRYYVLGVFAVFRDHRVKGGEFSVCMCVYVYVMSTVFSFKRSVHTWNKLLNFASTL